MTTILTITLRIKEGEIYPFQELNFLLLGKILQKKRSEIHRMKV